MSISNHFRTLTPLLPGDDPAEFNALLAELDEHFQPADLTETRQVREMADAEWRLRRLRQYSTLILESKIQQLAAAHPHLSPLELQARAYLESAKQLAFLQRQETQHQRQYDRAYADWGRYQNHKRLAERHKAQSMMDQFNIETETLLRQAKEAAHAKRQNETQNRTNEPSRPPQQPNAPTAHARAA